MKTHLSFRTRDLTSSVNFYRTLLEVEPEKLFDDYALFVRENPGLELALNRSDETIEATESAHYGVAADTSQIVDDAIERLTGAEFSVDVAREETCCYAIQTKVWVADPDGRRWEVYTVLEETGVRDGSDVGCCSVEADAEICCAV